MYFVFYKKVVKTNIRPDIFYQALTGYPALGLAGYPAGQMYGKAAKHYPVQP
jgi:hypothetical protein